MLRKITLIFKKKGAPSARGPIVFFQGARARVGNQLSPRVRPLENCRRGCAHWTPGSSPVVGSPGRPWWGPREGRQPNREPNNWVRDWVQPDATGQRPTAAAGGRPAGRRRPTAIPFPADGFFPRNKRQVLPGGAQRAGFIVWGASEGDTPRFAKSRGIRVPPPPPPRTAAGRKIKSVPWGDKFGKEKEKKRKMNPVGIRPTHSPLPLLGERGMCWT